MAQKIATYEAKELAIRPSNAGYEARQQAGRRIGPFAEAAGRAIKEVADLNASVEREAGTQATAMLRFEGLEQREDGGGVKVKYGGGLKDMFQMGSGGKEPDYARLNRLSELQDGPVAIAAAARRMVNAQSPLTHGLNPAQAYQRLQEGQGLTDAEYQQLGISQKYGKSIYGGGVGDYGKNGVQPNPEPSREDFEKQIQSDWQSDAGQNDPWGSGQFGPPEAYHDKTGAVTGSNIGSGQAAGQPSTTPLPLSDTSGAVAPYVNANGVGSDVAPAPIPQFGDTGVSSDFPTAPVAPPTATSQWPTVPSQGVPDTPVTPADNEAAPPFWGNLVGGM